MSVDELREAWLAAEQRAQAIMAEKDAALQAVRDEYGARLRQANSDASAAQKAMLNAEASAALVGRDDAHLIARNLGLELPEQNNG